MKKLTKTVFFTPTSVKIHILGNKVKNCLLNFNFRIPNAITDKCKRQKTMMYPQDSLVPAKVCLDSGDP